MRHSNKIEYQKQQITREPKKTYIDNRAGTLIVKNRDENIKTHSF